MITACRAKSTGDAVNHSLMENYTMPFLLSTGFFRIWSFMVSLSPRLSHLSRLSVGAVFPSGTPYPSALKFLRQIAHSGDKLDAAVGRDAPRFHHECTASTFMTPTHVAYMVHACSAAVARATAKAARKYAHARAISHSVRENTLARPAIVQPTF